MKNAIIASTSTVFGGEYLDYLTSEIKELFKDISTLIFIPYARPGGISHDEYTEKVSPVFKIMGIEVIGLHQFKNPVEAIENAEGVFTGGGNTFVLVDSLYKNEVLEPLRKRIFDGMPYLGTSAGSNICGVTINNTNDMPIVYPPSFKTMGIVPFNINPHYLDSDPKSKHMGETRETRIKEFHSQSTVPVVGLREGSWIRVNGEKNRLEGPLTARIFQQNKEPYELESGEEIIFQ